MKYHERRHQRRRPLCRHLCTRHQELEEAQLFAHLSLARRSMQLLASSSPGTKQDRSPHRVYPRYLVPPILLGFLFPPTTRVVGHSTHPEEKRAQIDRRSVPPTKKSARPTKDPCIHSQPVFSESEKIKPNLHYYCTSQRKKYINKQHRR